MKKSKGDWLYNILRSVFIIGAIVLVLWYAASCADESEAKAREQREEEDAELVRETEMRVWEEAKELLPPVSDIIMDALEPGEIEYCIEEGLMTPEEVAEEYRKLYDALCQICVTRLGDG